MVQRFAVISARRLTGCIETCAGVVCQKTIVGRRDARAQQLEIVVSGVLLKGGPFWVMRAHQCGHALMYPHIFFSCFFPSFYSLSLFFSLRHLMSGTCVSADTTAMMAECSVTASSQGMRGLTKGRSALHAFHLIYQDCRTRFSFFEASGRASDQNSWPTSNV